MISSRPTSKGRAMVNPFILKLAHGAEFSDEDRAELDKSLRNFRQISAHQDVISEGDRPEEVHAVLAGFACRYKMLPDGQRQVLAYLIPGDFCDIHIAILGEMDHSIASVGPCMIAYIPRRTVKELTEHHPGIQRALRWATLVDEGILREWLVNMGRREAEQRMAHLFCELLVRLETVGLAEDNSFDFPVTQSELGDTLGISTVHVNRRLQELRGKELVSFENKRVTIHDLHGLMEFADFDPSYLHLANRGGVATA